MIFVRKELTDQINIDKKFIDYPELLFDDTWYSIEKNKYHKLAKRFLAFLNIKILKKLKKLFFNIKF